MPVLSSVWAYLVLDEAFTWRHGVGMALVICAIELGRPTGTQLAQWREFQAALRERTKTGGAPF